MAIWDNEDPKKEYWDEKDEQYDNKLKNEFYPDFYRDCIIFGQEVRIDELYYMILDEIWTFEYFTMN